MAEAQAELPSPTTDYENNCGRSSGVISLKVYKVSRLTDRRYSEISYIRYFPFRVFVAPNVVKGEIAALAVYVECKPKTEASWGCKVHAEFALKSQDENIKDAKRKIVQIIDENVNDWGFAHFLSWNHVIDPKGGFCRDDCITIETKIFVESYFGMGWDSKTLSGYVGLKNQGATCYMNSLLQTLFFITKLRKAVYLMPVDYASKHLGTGLALQQLFYDLQFSTSSVETIELTQSFGWRPVDSFIQHDVQELCRILLANLEARMKGTSVDGTIPELFEGQMISKITCRNVNYQSMKTEPFYDIQLSLKDKKGVMESLRDYCAPEVLDGSNQYHAEHFGKQDAERRCLFKKFPPVLHLHLLRFQYDAILETNSKINDRFEYPEKLNLDEFLDKPEPTPANYILQSVLVHNEINKPNMGHYVSFISPKCDGEWFKFDDELVYKCPPDEAIRANFGGKFHAATAYMLVYIRESYINELLEPAHASDIPEELEERITTRRQVKRPLNNRHIEFAVFLEEHIYLHHGVGLIHPSKCKFRHFSTCKANSMENVAAQIAFQLGFPVDCIKVWKIRYFELGLFRPVEITAQELRMTADSYFSQNMTNFYVETTEPDKEHSTVNRPSKHDRLLFYKIYDPVENTLNYIGKRYVPRSATPRNAVELIDPDVGNLPKESILVFHETELITKSLEQSTIECMDIDEFFPGTIEDGDIIVYQKNLVNSADCPTVFEYFRELQNRMDITFGDKNDPEKIFVCDLNVMAKYDEIADAVAKQIGTSPKLLQLYIISKPTVEPRIELIQPSIYGTLQSLVSFFGSDKFMYERLPLSTDLCDSKRSFILTYFHSNLKDHREIVVSAEKTGTVRNLLDEALKKLPSKELDAHHGSGNLRLLSIDASKRTYLHSESELIGDLKADGTERLYRVEEILKEEVDCTEDREDSSLVVCSHFEETIDKIFGCSFVTIVNDGETIATLGERIRQRLNVSAKEFSQWEIAIVHGDQAIFPTTADRVDIDIFKASSRPFIGLKHVEKSREAELKIL